jgi:membrane-bound lytic murein transglycosylase B
MLKLLPACALLFAAPLAHAIDVEKDNVKNFIDEMVRDYDFDRTDLTAVLIDAEHKQKIIDAISTPAEKKLTWAEYRRIFITPERIEAGAEFWREHAQMLGEIAASSGVSEEILIGIIGVETYYGRITGSYRVVDALSTLAFGYPPRETFFRKELVEFLLLSREEGMPPANATGSYAGAMGRPQFMPSSFRAYAIDSTGDGKRDIWENWTDVAGSIANYFNAHGWHSGEPIATLATLGSRWEKAKPEPANTLKPGATVKSLSEEGVMFVTDMAEDSSAELLAYEGAEGMEYWVAFHNFFVITRYNRSVMYALAVMQLGQEVRAEFDKYAE